MISYDRCSDNSQNVAGGTQLFRVPVVFVREVLYGTACDAWCVEAGHMNNSRGNPGIDRGELESRVKGRFVTRIIDHSFDSCCAGIAGSLKENR
jgi:hypothetical protein